MEGGLIPFEELPEWVPGKVLLASDGQNWKRVALRSYHYQGQDVVVPAMRDFMLVSYRTGTTPMQRRFDGRWKKETLGPGAASLLTQAQQAYWNWHEPIDVTHIYLSGEMVAEVASGHDVIEPTEEGESDWVKHHDETANATLIGKTNSWYTGSNVPGKPRRVLSYTGGVGTYRDKCDEMARNGYPSFAMTKAGVPADA